MSISGKNFMLFAAVAAVLCVIAAVQSVAVAVTIVNLCLVSAVMSLGLNIQWGYAGLPNLGVMGFAALGGLAVVLVSAPGVPAAIRRWRTRAYCLLCRCRCHGSSRRRNSETNLPFKSDKGRSSHCCSRARVSHFGAILRSCQEPNRSD